MRSIAKSEGLDNSIFHFRRPRDLFMERQVAKKVVKIVKLFIIQFFLTGDPCLVYGHHTFG